MQAGKGTARLRWNRFTIRAMLVGVTLLGVCLAVFAATARRRREVNALLQFDDASVFALYGEYEYSPPINIGGILMLGGQRLHGFSLQGTPSRWEEFWTSILGVHAMTEVSMVYWETPQVADSDLKLLERFPELKELYLSNATITDAAIEHLLELKQLVVLDISNTGISRSGLQRLSTCRKLRELGLHGMQIDEEDVRQLENSLPNCAVRW